MRKPTSEEYENPSILKLDLTVDTSLWDPSSPVFSQMKQSVLNLRRWLAIYATPEMGQLITNSVTLCAYDTADVMNDDNFVNVLETMSLSCP